jgi:Cysteine-rich secretory protein family
MKALHILFAISLIFTLISCDDDSSNDNNTNNINNVNNTNNINNTNNVNNINNINNINNVNNINNTSSNNTNNITDEVCDNNSDDDGDGIVDCKDIDCALTSTCLDTQDHMGLSDEEWDVFIFTNIARTDPHGFAAEYLAGGNDNGAFNDLMGRTPVNAVALHQDLIDAATAHTDDMATDCGMQHDSCDGTAWSTRIQSYYTGSTISENIAWGYGTGQSVVIGWIIDEGIPSLGHRNNILNGGLNHMGIAENSTYWTQDFGSGGK